MQAPDPKTSLSSPRCNVICSSEARHIDVPSFCDSSYTSQDRAIARECDASACCGGLHEAPERSDRSSADRQSKHTGRKAALGCQPGRLRIANPEPRKNAEVSARSGARCATLGAGGCNSPLHPIPGTSGDCEVMTNRQRAGYSRSRVTVKPRIGGNAGVTWLRVKSDRADRGRIRRA